MTPLFVLASRATAASTPVEPTPPSCPLPPPSLDRPDEDRLGGERDFLVSGYRELFPISARVEPRLRGVVEDALAHPGRLFRAHLAYCIQRGHGIDRERARELAMAIEYFHTASLLFDDMPMMDDAAQRRGFPCAHLVHGEAATTLGALGFISQAYALLWRVIGTLDDSARMEASRVVHQCIGVEGVLDGQAHDLRFADSERDETAVLRVACGKTVTLVRLTLVLPAIVGGAEAETIRRLERLAVLWGLSYQILDDFKDLLMSPEETGKTGDRDTTLDRPNLAAAIGHRRALIRLGEMLAEADAELQHFRPEIERWSELDRLQQMLTDEVGDLRSRLSLVAV